MIAIPIKLRWPVQPRLVLAGATLFAAPLPYLAQSGGERALAESLGRCGSGNGPCGGLDAVELDAGGINLTRPWKTARGLKLVADTVEIRPTWDGVEVHVEGLSHETVPRPAPSPTPADATPEAERAVPASPGHVDTHGIPVRIVARGTHTVRRGGAALTVHDPVIEVDAGGAVRASFDADVRRGPVWAASAGRLRASPREGWTTWSVGGDVVLGDGDALTLAATVSRSRLELELRSPDAGALAITAEPEARAATVRATGFSAAALGELAAGDLAGGRVDLRRAVFDGALTVSADDGWTVDIPTLMASGAMLEHTKLARDPIALGTVLIAGRAHATDVNRFEGEFSVEHDGVGVRVAARRDTDRLAVNAQLPATPCQALLDAVPDGMAGVVRGTQLRGEIGGLLDVEVRFSELPAWHARLDADPEDPGAPPGRLELDFDFLQRCAVTADPPDVDFAGLRGPYRHAFVDGTGRRRSRMMAPGADGYAPLASVRLAAGAFITLEDAYYRKHDGFDRTQMANALWHNFQVGRISRGASTISQQAARNLFLGVDRSIGRKLQEALLTARLEAEVSKSRILELYVNIIELGPGIHGVQDAAMFHFGKRARDLNVVQAIHLAMLAPAPHLYSERYASGTVDEAWAKELRSHIFRMHRHGFITQAQMREAYKQELDLLQRD